MVHVLNQMPTDSPLKDQSYPEIRSELERRSTEPEAVLLTVKHPLGTVVALAGVYIESEPGLGRVAHVSELAASSRAVDGSAEELIEETVAWAREHGAASLALDITPEPGTTAGDFAERYDFVPGRHGGLLLDLAGVAFTTVTPDHE